MHSKNISLSYLKGLRFAGDWIVNRNDVILLNFALKNNCWCFGKRFKFRKMPIQRGLLRSLQLNNPSFFTLLLRLADSLDLELIRLGPVLETVYVLRHLVQTRSNPQIWAKTRSFLTDRSSLTYNKKLLYVACQCGLTNVVEFLISICSLCNFRKAWRFMTSKSTHNSEECLKMFKLIQDSNSQHNRPYIPFLKICALRGSIALFQGALLYCQKPPNVFQLLPRKLPPPLKNRVIFNSIGGYVDSPHSHKRLPFIEYMMQTGWNYNSFTAFSAAVKCPDTVILNYILEKTAGLPKPFMDDIILICCRFNRLSALKTLYTMRSASRSSLDFLFDAARTKSADCTAWLFTHKCHKCYSSIHALQRMFHKYSWVISSVILDIIDKVKEQIPAPMFKDNHRCKEFALLMKECDCVKQCVICLDDVSHEEVYQLECGHCFHTKCISQCSRHICPTCRTPFKGVYI